MPVAKEAPACEALPQPPPLGFPVPAHRHAISVQVPTWKDLQGIVEQTPRILDAQQIGYPRSFLNQNVVKVHDACLNAFGLQGERCMVFPALNHAMSCKAVLCSSTPDMEQHIRLHMADFFVDESSVVSNRVEDGLNHHDPGTGAVNDRRRFFPVFFPAKLNGNAMVFWRLTGTGISSRLAESLQEGLNHILSIPIGCLSSFSHIRELANTKTDATLRSRIVSLLKLGSISPARSANLSPSDVYLYPSGMAAIYEVNKVLRTWMSAQSVIFGFPYELTLKLLQAYGVKAKFYGFGSTDELDQFEEYLASEKRQGRSIQSVWCECPSNPLLRTVDLARIRALADVYGFLVVVDDTIGSFANVDVAGVADIIVTSLTKSFSGNANVLAGSVVLVPASPAYTTLKRGLNAVYVNELFGADSLVLEYNSRKFLARAATLNRNASYLVSLLEPLASTPSSTITHVYYPSTCWSRTNYEALMREVTPGFTPGYGGLFTIDFESVAAASAFFDAINVHKGPSLGAPVTIANPYVQMVFSKEKVWSASYGLKETIVRISVGLEDETALGHEFIRALRSADKFKVGRECRGYFENML